MGMGNSVGQSSSSIVMKFLIPFFTGNIIHCKVGETIMSV